MNIRNEIKDNELWRYHVICRTLMLCSGHCHCEHNTAGEHCERCAAGYYGSPVDGTPYDCQPCPCPPSSNCVQLLDGQVACLDCPAGYTGMYSVNMWHNLGTIISTPPPGGRCKRYALKLSALQNLLPRALQALSDPYCQSTCLSVSVRLSVRDFDAKYLGN